MIVVKTHIEIERLPGQLCAQSIRGCPGDVFTQICHTDRDHLLHQSYTDKREGCERQRLQGLACQRRIDKVPHDLRGKDTKANTDEQHDSQQNKPSLLRADMLREEIPVSFER